MVFQTQFSQSCVFPCMTWRLELMSSDWRVLSESKSAMFMQVYIVTRIVVLLSFGYWNPFVINSEVRTIKIKYSIKIASSILAETPIPVQTTPIGSNSRRIVLCGSQWNNEIRWIIDLHPITQFLILKSDQKSKTYSFW